MFLFSFKDFNHIIKFSIIFYKKCQDNKKAPRGFFSVLGEVGGKRVKILRGALTGVIKISKFDGVEVADDVIADDVVKENHVAGSHKIQNALLPDTTYGCESGGDPAVF